MHKSDRSRATDSFSVVDVTVDLLLIATAVVTFAGVPDFLYSTSTGFLVNLAQTAMLFAGYFGLALYVSRMYYSAAVQKEGPWDHKVLHATGPILAFTTVFVINILVSAYNILQTIAPPVFTSLIVVAEGLVFGFTFGLDHAIQRGRARDQMFAIPRENISSHSLEFVPYLVLTFVLLYPLDYVSLRFERIFPLIGRIITLLGACVAVAFLSNRLNRRLSTRLSMTAHMNRVTVSVVSVLMVVGFTGLNVLEAFAKKPVTIADSSVGAHLAFLFFFGIVPLRIGAILFSRTALLNRILGVISLALYLSVESGLLHAGSFG